MTLREAAVLTEGQRVVWPDGDGGCNGAVGIVRKSSPRNAGWISWDDGQITCLQDRASLHYVKIVNSTTQGPTK